MTEKKKEIAAAAAVEDDERTLYEEEEDPYRWVILFSGFLAQAISMSTLSSWYVQI